MNFWRKMMAKRKELTKKEKERIIVRVEGGLI